MNIHVKHTRLPLNIKRINIKLEKHYKTFIQWYHTGEQWCSGAQRSGYTLIYALFFFLKGPAKDERPVSNSDM